MKLNESFYRKWERYSEWNRKFLIWMFAGFFVLGILFVGIGMHFISNGMEISDILNVFYILLFAYIAIIVVVLVVYYVMDNSKRKRLLIDSPYPNRFYH